MKNIFGVADTDETATEASAPMDDFVLDLSDADLEGRSVEYTPIPAGTVTNFHIYEVEPGRSKNGNPQWQLTLKTMENTWGEGKQIRQTITFSPKNPFVWAPFLKSVGMVKSAGRVNLAELNPKSLEGTTIQAEVLGYNWKQRPGTSDPAYPKSYGKGAVTAPKPEDGVPMYEQLGKWAAVTEDDSDELNIPAGFDASDYV